MNTETRSDDELIAAYLDGEESAFSSIVERYLPSVYSFAFRLIGTSEEAEDAAQETFLKAWKNLRRFRKGAKMKTWLFSIARNAVIDRLRKKRPVSFSDIGQNSEDEDFEHNLKSEEPGAETLFDAALDRARVEEALERLAPMYREILILHYHEALTLEEASNMLGIPLNTAKSRDRRALQALKKILEPKKA